MTTIGQLQAAHVERQEEWCPDQKPDLSFRGNEMGGEAGEAMNVIKKLERERHGWRGSRDTVEHLGEELADVVHTAILCAITAGIDLEPYVISKFNDTSDKNGLRTRLVAA
jgi:NTP pyrophosphatase (non-canonical NTP hydrolase)